MKANDDIRRRPSGPGARAGRPPVRGGAMGWLRAQFAKKPKPVWMVVAGDVLLIGIALVVFALFHHVLPRHEASVGLVSSRESAADRSGIAAVSDETDAGGVAEAFDLSAMSDDAVSLTGGAEATTAQVEITTEPIPDDADDIDEDMPDDEEDLAEDVGMAEAGAVETANVESEEAALEVGSPEMSVPGDFGKKFKKKFTGGEVVASEDGYKSKNVNIALRHYHENGLSFYVADIYVRDISCLVTAFAKDTFGKGIREWAQNISSHINAVIAINGDYYGGRDDGIVIRNGELYRTDEYPTRDICVLFWDGTMETYGPGKFYADEAIAGGAYQAWNFGPRLLDENGRAKTQFNSEVLRSNPRTAIGYYEPGHYCFVVVDGRNDETDGLSLKKLAALMEALGCVRAYNLDGGNTSVMVAGGQIVNEPSNGGRATSDIIAIVDR